MNEINEAQEEYEDTGSEPDSRTVVVPGEVIASGEDFLPGEGTRREGNDVVASRYGLAEKIGRVVKITPL